MNRLTRFAIVIGAAGAVLASATVALAGVAGRVADSGSAASSPVELGPLDQRSYVYAADGTLIAAFMAEQNRQPVALEELPSHVPGIVLAVEDEAFYSHDGVNVRAVARALIRNVDVGGISQGGSTITQQLVKTEVLTDDRTVERKVREALLALRLEQEMSKDEILERYLNTVYFGHGAYGVQAAAETYFGIDAPALDEAQVALLAGMIANPSRFDPIRFPERARSRRSFVVDRLVTTGLVSAEEGDRLREAPLPTETRTVVPPPEDHFVEEVKRQLLDDERLGGTRDERAAALFRGGLQIHTTLDLRAQRLAVEARDEVLEPFRGEGMPAGTFPLPPDPDSGEERYGTAAVVSVEPGSGAVRAMVGGPEFDTLEYNLTTQSFRSPGSSFKTFVLAALLENGYSVNDTVDGTGPCSFRLAHTDEPYRVENFANSGGSVGTVRSQTLRSSNCAYVRLGQVVGLDEVVEVAEKLGITSNLDPSIVSMPLGSVDVLAIDMAGAYAAFPNDGVVSDPYLIERVVDRNGRIVFDHDQRTRRAVSSSTARWVTSVLEGNVRGGTGTRARLGAQPAAGKTGTAQDSSDGWFVGFTPYLSTAVWIGSPQGKVPIRLGGRGITGGSYPAQIWGRYMGAYHEGLEVRDFDDPPNDRRGGRFLRLDRDLDLTGARDPDDTTSSTDTTLDDGSSSTSIRVIPIFPDPPDITFPRPDPPGTITIPSLPDRPTTPTTAAPPSTEPPPDDPDEPPDPGPGHPRPR